MKELKTCLQCNGRGKIFFRPNTNHVPYVDCDICNGTGLAERSDLWEALGLIMKSWRIEKGIGLREASRRYGIDPSNLSKMERGIINSNPVYLKMCLEIKGKEVN